MVPHGSDALNPERYRNVLASILPRPRVLDIDLHDAGGLVAAQQVTAPFDLPSFDNAAMDGFALNPDRSTGPPTTVTIRSEVPAGSPTHDDALGPGWADQVMTGAPVPDRATVVVPVEDTSGFGAPGDRVTIQRMPAGSSNIRRRGEDVARHSLVLRAGDRLSPGRLATLAALGIRRLPVEAPLRALVVSAGAELAADGPLRSALIYDSNSLMLNAQLSQAGCVLADGLALGDDPVRYRHALEAASKEVDLVVTSGGISAGAHEVTREALGPALTTLHVAMRPGSPHGYGTLGQTPVVCLPGNPVAAFVSFEVLLAPSLRARHGLPAPVDTTREITVPSGARRPGTWTYLPAAVARTGRIEPVGSGRSAPYRGLADATHLICVPPKPAVDTDDPGGLDDVVAWPLGA